MRKIIGKWLACAVAIGLSAVFAAVLLIYIWPMKDAIYNLTLGWETEAVPSDWVYDQKGWTVFTQTGEKVVELTPDGYGGFTGLDEMGQTFYYSRLLTEELDSPALRLGAANQSLAVFLDGNLIYTDCPELDNRIGYLELPMLDWDRTESVIVTLPVDYVGKTLTIAQSTDPRGGDKQEPDETVWPCSVTLYCGYAYESALIMESFRTAIPAAFAYLAGLVLLAAFVWQVFQGKIDVGLISAAALPFLWLTMQMYSTSFAYSYFGIMWVDPMTLCRELMVLILLVFLASRLTGERRVALLIFTIVQAAFTLLHMGFQITERNTLEFWRIQDEIGLAVLLAAVVCGVLEWRRGSWFFRWFCFLAAAETAVFAAAVCAAPVWRNDVWEQIQIGAVSYFLRWLELLMIVAALAVAITEQFRKEISRRTERRLLQMWQDLAQDSYEAMRRQHEQVMMIRHDMMRHFRFLRQMTDGQAANYLEELIGQNEKIRPIVQSGNEIVNIILNSKLSAAADAGIKIAITRMSVPETLPLSDAGLCSLLMNIVDNAITAASSPEIERPYIALDMHTKGNFFVFSCKNSALWKQGQREEPNDGIPEHGLGLKIIRQITQRCGGLVEMIPGSDCYEVLLAIPLL